MVQYSLTQDRIMDANGSEKSPPDSLKQTREAVTETLKSATAPIRSTIGKHLLLKMLVLAVIALIMLHFLSVITIPFAPFTTKGKIYVDSPEVYTRERLVNDRYDQDYWLKKQLNRLDELKLWLVQEKRIVKMDVLAGESNAVESPARPSANNLEGRLTFDQEFRVISGIRDTIRQQILENMLDDRHDLTGNSVYGLKFDTTVIPGANTRGRAFVHVKMQINNLFNREARSGLGDHIMGYVASRAVDWNGDQSWLQGFFDADDQDESKVLTRNLVRTYTKQHEYYLKWLSDISKRLNRMEDSVYGSMKIRCDGKVKDTDKVNGQNFYDELTSRTLEIVLGVPHELFSDLNQETVFEDQLDGWVTLPPPWANFFSIHRKKPSFSSAGKDVCSSNRVWFEVEPIEESIFPSHKTSLQSFMCIKKPTETFIDGSCAEDEKVVVQMIPESASLQSFVCIIKPTETFIDGACAEDEKAAIQMISESALLPFWWCEKKQTEIVEQDAPKETAMNQTEEQKQTDASEMVDGGETMTEGRCAEDEDKVVSQMIPIGEVEDGNWKLYVDHHTYALRNKILGEKNVGPQYQFSSQVIEELLKNNRGCDYKNGNQEMSGEVLDQCRMMAPSGFFNFAEHLSALDAYSYAIFPKNDVVGVLAETSAALAGSASGAGFFGIGAGVSESRTASVMVGYGDGKGGGPDNEETGDDGSIAFGWVISTRGDMEPTLKNQLALVSVPAWTDILHLTVHVGWLDRESNPLSGGRDEFDVSISVPPDFEAFDSIFRDEAWVTHGPRIQDDKMDKNLSARSGQPLKILIPGSRLWRSASVTLGAQQANRIRVLPNMEGIIAEFPPIDLPHAAYKYNKEGDVKLEECKEFEQLQSRPVRLRVWTSEGVVKAERPVCVYFDPKLIKEGRKQSDNFQVWLTGNAKLDNQGRSE
jgi:hypothetical protein